MAITSSEQLRTQIRSKAGDPDRWLTTHKSGIFLYQRNVPQLLRSYYADAPKARNWQKSTGTRSIFEARHHRDLLELKHNSRWVAVLEALEAGKEPKFLSWQELEEHVELEDLSHSELDTVAIPESATRGSLGFDRGMLYRHPAVTHRDLLIDALLDKLSEFKLDQSYENLRARGAIYQDETFEDFLGSDLGQRLIDEKPGARRALRQLDKLKGNLTWPEAAEKLIDEKIHMSGSSKKNIRHTAMKLDKMGISSPATISAGEVDQLLINMIKQDLTEGTIREHFKRAKRIVKACFKRDRERLAVWEDVEIYGRKTEKQPPIRIEHVEQLFAVKPPSEIIKSIVRVVLYTGARASEVLVKGNYNREEKLFEIAQDPGVNAKTEAGARRMPVHPEIESDLDFLSRVHTNYSTQNKHFRAWRRSAGLPEVYSLHNVRHGFANRLGLVGASYEAGTILSGHSMNHIQSHYRHRRAEDLRDDVLRLDWAEKVSNWR